MMQGEDLQAGKYVTSGRLPGPPLQPYLCYVPGDLQQELAYLRAHVFPQLDSLCQARRTCFRPVDIQQREDDDQEDHNLSISTNLFHQQLKISLDLISSSSLFFCLLGQSYGCFLPEDSSYVFGHPDKELSQLSELEQNLHEAVRGGYTWVMEEKYRTCSLVELEIIQAAFMGKPMQSFFYFKDYTAFDNDGDDDDDDDDDGKVLSSQKLWELKSRIINSCLPVRFFRNVQELKELVKKDWSSIIDQFPSVPDQHFISGYQEVWHHESYIQALCHVFVPSMQTTEMLEVLNTFVFPVTHYAKSKHHADHSGVQLNSNSAEREAEKSILLLSGERGCGKSSLAAWWLQTYRKRSPRVPVIPIFCGTSTLSKDIRSLLRQCTAELRKVFYGERPEWVEGLEDRVEPRPLLVDVQAFTAAAQLGPCVLLLDGLDLLTNTLGLSLQEVKELRWLPVALPSLCKLIVTTTSTDLTYKSLTSRSDVQVFTCPVLSDPSIQQSVLLQHLALPLKDLPTSLLQRLMQKKLCGLPVVLALLGSELRMCGMQREGDEESELIDEYLEVDSVSELWVKVIHRWVKDYSRPVEDSMSSSSREETNTVTHRPVCSPPSLELRGWVWDTLCLIHVSRSGLTEAELLALLEDLGHCGHLRIQALEWARIRTVFGPWVREKPNGLLGFSHQSISQAMELLLTGVVDQEKSRSYFHRVIAKFFQKPNTEPAAWLRKLEELPWHLTQTRAFEELHSVLTNPEAMSFLSSSVRQYPQLRLDLVGYWTLLSQRGFDPVSSLQSLIELNESALLSSVAPPVRDDKEMFITEVQAHTGCGEPSHLGFVGNLALLCFDVLLCLGKTNEAEKILLQGERTFQQADELDGDRMRLLLEEQLTLVQFYIHTQQLDKAEMCCNKSLQMANVLTVTASASTENIRMIKGQLLCSLCQLELDRSRLYSVPGILKKINKTGFMSVHPCAEATVTLLQGRHKRVTGELCGAESCLQAVVVSRRRWYGSEHVLVAAAEEHLADIWTESLHTETDWVWMKAAELYRHVICVRETAAQCWGMTCFMSRPTLQDLTCTLTKLGKVLLQSWCKAEKREALSLLHRAADLSHLLNPGHPLPRHLQHVIKTDITRDEKPLMPTIASKSRATSADRLQTERLQLCEPYSSSNKVRLTTGHSGSRSASHKPNSELEKTLTRPWTVFQTTLFGPQSDIRSLVPRAGLCGSRKAENQDRCAWRPLPVRSQALEEAVKALNRHMGTPVHRKSAY